MRKDTVAHAILLSIRSDGKASAQIARECGLAQDEAERKLAEMERLELLARAPEAPEGWITSIPIFLKRDLTGAEEIGCKYAAVEAKILRDALPGVREAYDSCVLSGRFPWEKMSLIVTGALLADFGVQDRVRFLARLRDERLVLPVHRDGSRWSCAAYQKLEPRFPRKRWAFYQNEDGPHDALSRFGYSGEQRRQPPEGLYSATQRKILMGLARGPFSLFDLASTSGACPDRLACTLSAWQHADPPAVTIQDGRYVLEIPIFSSADLACIVSCTDKVAEIIHRRVTVPSLNERIGAGSRLGLRFPVAEGFLARDVALQMLIEEGLLARPPSPPVSWNFGVWGWEGNLSRWDDVAAGPPSA
jgi:hypothetical protein